MTAAVVTYIYPKGLIFLEGFLQSLAAQSVTDFELVVFNDCVENLTACFTQYKGKYTIIPVTGTPVEIRFKSLDSLAATGFEQIIFQDIDDEMSANRVAQCLAMLQTYDLVTNDLLPMDSEGVVNESSSWAGRLKDGFEFDYRFITDKNIVGLGNSAIRRKLLEHPLHFHGSPLAADWFIFYQLMIASDAKAVFTSACHTLYRQHPENSAGFRQTDVSRLKYVVHVCKMQYEALTAIGYNFLHEELGRIIKTENLLLKNNYKYLPPVGFENLYWWEEKNYIYEKD